MTAKFIERAVLLGPRRSLVAVLTRPVAPMPREKPAIIILNTGIIHRVGHNRMFVTLARTLARRGHAVLRFDFSGIGDSDPRGDSLTPLQSCLADIREAMDWMERECGASRVVIVGLCSGADHGILYGPTDARVRGLVLIDPTIPATARYYVHYVAQRLTRLGNWMSVLTGRSRIIRLWLSYLARAVSPKSKAQPLTLQSLQGSAVLEAVYRDAIAQGMRLLGVFTADSTRQTYREQMLEAFPKVAFGDQLHLEFFGESDHTFSRDADRARLMTVISDWVETVNSDLADASVVR